MEENQNQNVTQSVVEQQTPSGAAQQTIIIQQTEKKGNGLGTAGFILSLLGLIFCWVPVLNFILWLLGLVFSFAAMFKQPRGLAITGLCLSLISIIIMVSMIGLFAAAIAAS